MIKTMLLPLAWFASGALVIVVMLAPYLGSVISNIGRRPVVLQPARTRGPRRPEMHARHFTAN